MDAITLYADQIQALASADDAKNLTTNEQSFASNLNDFAKKQGFTNLGIASDVEAAVMGITGMILDSKKETDTLLKYWSLHSIARAARSKPIWAVATECAP